VLQDNLHVQLASKPKPQAPGGLGNNKPIQDRRSTTRTTTQIRYGKKPGTKLSTKQRDKECAGSTNPPIKTFQTLCFLVAHESNIVAISGLYVIYY
jgi:hypothetical protein